MLQIGPEGALALAAALKTNPVLSYLNLSGTDIGKDGVMAEGARSWMDSNLAINLLPGSTYK